jgi:ABC-type proline/glycine betaine transport system ATPase subunit
MVLLSFGLFPTMSVRGNFADGLKMQRHRRQE